ncbi:hypothetical protein H072_2085 [Dactylellina haptotyla CBS 200.50]|uniref:Uncharacterized protein n=1 Tax=Dactylellina haptotyla (strain CBS 200.50) TaxID=1284197 RepID=S8C8K2_DACHA|nr:hypothetical protein H072_2085 [Dactylellina haptotyla CBS 200.50]
MPSRITTTTSTVSRSKTPHGQVQLRGAHILPPSPSSSPDSFLLDQYRDQSSPKRFPLKNLRRKSPQPNLHDAASHPTIYIHRRSHDSSGDRQPVNLADLQTKITILNRNIHSAGAALKKAEDEREAWRERARSLEHRNRSVGRENRDLKVRNAELEQEITRKKRVAQEGKYYDRDDGSPLRGRKGPRSISSYSEESKAVRSLISHHWNIQAEMAGAAAAGNADWCDCIASKTVRAVLREGSNKTSPMLQAKGFEDVAKGSPSGTHKKLEVPITDKLSDLKLPKAALPVPGAQSRRQPKAGQPEVVDEGRKKRRDSLKRRIKEVRGYVEGLKRENDVLESLLVGGDSAAPSTSSNPLRLRRRNDITTPKKASKKA